MHIHKSRLLGATGIVTFMLFGPPSVADAQVAPVADPAVQASHQVEPAVVGEDITTREDIVATGFRGSLERALNVKRNSNSVVDSIVAEDIA